MVDEVEIEQELESEEAAGAPERTSWRGWAAAIAGAQVLAFVLRLFVVQVFWIPSESMEATLVLHDRVVVDKVSYRFHEPRRGDVIVFERPPAEPASGPADYIKRVIALPGERVAIVDGTVRVDGRVLEEPYVRGVATVRNPTCLRPGVDLAGIDDPAGWRVPEGTVFVLGDNREHSQDGRCFGAIDQDAIVGRARAIIWPLGRAGGL